MKSHMRSVKVIKLVFILNLHTLRDSAKNISFCHSEPLGVAIFFCHIELAEHS